MSAVVFVIHWVVSVFVKVPADSIIYVSVLVVVNSIAGNFSCVYPDIVSQIRMCVINAAVYNAYNDFRVSGKCIPRFGSM